MDYRPPGALPTRPATPGWLWSKNCLTMQARHSDISEPRSVGSGAFAPARD